MRQATAVTTTCLSATRFPGLGDRDTIVVTVCALVLGPVTTVSVQLVGGT